MKKILARFFKFTFILFFCTIFSLALDGWGVRAENIMMIFITGVLIVITETKQLLYGVIASVVSVAVFNFLFTEPKYTFIVDDPDYLITFGIFLVVALIGSTLTRNLQKQAILAKSNAENSRILYEISSGSFLLANRDRIVQFCISKIAAAFACSVIVDLLDESGLFLQHYSTDSSGEEKKTPIAERAALWCFNNSTASGFGTDTFSGCKWKYLPLKSRSHVFGVIGIYCIPTEPDADSLFIIETIASQLALAIERDSLYRRDEQSRLEIEKEKLRNSLLRSISHDLRTPLTAIAGSTDFIIDSFDKLEKETMLGLLGDIGSDAVWLINMVENLLNMTRLQDGKLVVHTAPEIVDELVQEAAKRVGKLLGESRLSVILPERVLTVDVDAILLVQVLVNLLTNSIKHNPRGVQITLSVQELDGNALFEVLDTGRGFPGEMLSSIFSGDPAHRMNDQGRGTGLGLSICKAIVKAHGGTISAYNQRGGGACIRFSIPCTHPQGKEPSL